MDLTYFKNQLQIILTTEQNIKVTINKHLWKGGGKYSRDNLDF